MTVILIGEGGYEELDLLAEAIEDRDGDPVVWDTNEWPGDIPVTYDVSTESVTVDSEFRVEDVTGVFPVPRHVFDLMRPRFADEYEEVGTRHLYYKLDQWRAVFNSIVALFDHHGATVFYPPWTQHYHHTKPLQMEQLAAAGVSIPETIFATDPDRIEEFVAEHGEVVYKPVAARAYPERISAAEMDDLPLDRLSNAPVQFQAYVPGDDLRVFFLDDEVVGASRYVTDEWTFKDSTVEDAERVELRKEIRRDVERAARISPMRFGAVDVRATEKTHALLEVNPCPRFAFHDLHDATDVAGVLADRLV